MRVFLIGFGVAALLWVMAVGVLLVVGRRGAARELVFLLPNLLALFRGLLKDPRVPRRAKVILGIGVAWVVSPIDLIPEFLPVVGPLDDAIMAGLVLRYILKRAGRDVVTEHWHGDPATLQRILRLSGA